MVSSCWLWGLQLGCLTSPFPGALLHLFYVRPSLSLLLGFKIFRECSYFLLPWFISPVCLFSWLPLLSFGISHPGLCSLRNSTAIFFNQWIQTNKHGIKRMILAYLFFYPYVLHRRKDRNLLNQPFANCTKQAFLYNKLVSFETIYVTVNTHK